MKTLFSVVVFLKIVQAKKVEHKPSEIMEKYLQRQVVLKNLTKFVMPVALTGINVVSSLTYIDKY